MKAAVICILVLLVAACEGVSVTATAERPPALDLGPPRPLPSPPPLTPIAKGDLVCFTPEEAVELGDFIAAKWPSWARELTARYEIYRSNELQTTSAP